MKIGKAVIIVILLFGIILITSGYGIQAIAANNEDFRDASQLTETLLDRELTPQLVGEILNDGLKVDGIISITITMDDLLKFVDESQQDTLLFYANVYALSPVITYIGFGVTALGIILLIVRIIQSGKEKKQYETA